MPPAIALLTDFGLADPYVAQMKAVLLGRAPGVPVVDVSHEVEPFVLAQAGFILAATRPFFPQGTIFLCVVDPGVGSQRRAIAARAGDYYFVAPDNGLLTFPAERSGEWDVRLIENSAYTLGDRSRKIGRASCRERV